MLDQALLFLPGGGFLLVIEGDGSGAGIEDFMERETAATFRTKVGFKCLWIVVLPFNDAGQLVRARLARQRRAVGVVLVNCVAARVIILGKAVL